MRAALVLGVVLVLAPSAAAQDVERGKTLFAGRCASCHGATAEGVATLGPPLRGVGARAADFYLTTGYMPLDDAHEQPRRRQSPFRPDQLQAIVAYIASFGGPAIPQPRPDRGNLSDGLRLFTEHCSGCHQIVGEGGVVTDAVAPPLDDSTPIQIAEAVRIGPYVMPAFPESQISNHELDSIIRYVQDAKNPEDRGGWGLGHIGPIPEGMVAWLIAGLALVGVALVIASRHKEEQQ